MCSSDLIQNNMGDDAALELVGSAIGHLLLAQPFLCDLLPPMGHLKPILKAMESNSNSTKRVASILLRHIATNVICSDALRHHECIQPIVNGMRKNTGSDVIPLTCEALNHLYSANHSELVHQALESQLIQVLLQLLRGNGVELGPNPAGTKAHIVKTLQRMSSDETYGAEVEAILGKSDIWAQYKHQVRERHAN